MKIHLHQDTSVSQILLSLSLSFPTLHLSCNISLNSEELREKEQIFFFVPLQRIIIQAR